MTTYNTGNPVGSVDPKDLYDNAQNLDNIVNGSEHSYADRLGVARRSLAGIDAAADAVLSGLGYAPPVTYAAGISLTLTTQTVEYNGEVYAPKLSALPFTTGGTFDPAKFRVIQGVLAADLAAPGGSALVGYDDGTAQDVLDNAKPVANYTALRNYTGRATGVRITQAGLAGIFQRDDADTISADNGGTVIVDGAGRRWRRLSDDGVNVRWFGAKGDWNGTTGTDDTTAFNAAITATPEYGTLVISGGKYLVRGTVNVTNKNINIECSGTVYLTDEVNSRIGFENTEVLTLPGASLSVLPKIGDSTLQWASAPAGVDDASKYFFVLSSTEEEITRVGYEHYTPYTKNEAGDITNWGWLLRAPIKLDYTDASKLTVRLYKKRDPVTVKGLRVVMANTINASSKLNRLILRGLSNVNFENLIVDSTAVNVAGTAVSIEFCVGLSFTNSTCVGPSAAGDTYAFLNSTSAFLTFKNCEYRNPYNAALKVERGYAARHGANITFDGCRFNGVDDHYGHDYLIENMTFNHRGVSFAGGNMTIRNCQHVGSFGLFEMRSDAPYAYGTLTIDNCIVDGVDFLIRCTNDSDPLGRTTKVKYFDNIIIKNTVLNWRKQADALRFYHRHAAQGHVFQKTKLLRLKDVVFNKLFANIECAFKGTISEAGLLNWAERAEFIDVDYRLIVTKTTGSYAETASVAIRDFLVDELYVQNFKNFLPYGNRAIQKITAVDSYIGGTPGGDTSFPAGNVNFKSCDIQTLLVTNSASTAVFTLTDCTIGTAVYGSGIVGSDLKNRTAYLSRNKALPGIDLTNVPAGGLEYYINPAYYKTA